MTRGSCIRRRAAMGGVPGAVRPAVGRLAAAAIGRAARAVTPLVVAAALSVPSARAGEPAGADSLHAPFDRILRATVRGERVDYAALRSRHRAALAGYLESLARVDPTTLPRDASLAFHINLYNAAMLAAVADRYRPGYSVAENGHAVFDEPLVRMRGDTLTLNALEHERIRPAFRDPRIHAALVCAAVSCPPLDPGAFTAANLEMRLERNMRRFVNDPGRNRVDTKTRTLALSSIFDWYAEDFGGRDGVAAYVDRYHPERVTGYAVRFLPYDWTLNDAPSGR